VDNQAPWDQLASDLRVRPFRATDAEEPRDNATPGGFIRATSSRSSKKLGDGSTSKVTIDETAVKRIAQALQQLPRKGYQELDRQSREYEGIRKVLAPHGCCAAVFGAIAYGLVEYQTGASGSQWEAFEREYARMRAPSLHEVERAALAVRYERPHPSKATRLGYLLPRVRAYLSRQRDCEVHIPSLWLRLALDDSEAPDRKTIAFAMKMARYALDACRAEWPDLREVAVVAVDGRVLQQSLAMGLIVPEGIAERKLQAGDREVRRTLVKAWDLVVQALGPDGPDAFEIDTLLWEINSIPETSRVPWLQEHWGMEEATARSVFASLYPQRA